MRRHTSSTGAQRPYPMTANARRARTRTDCSVRLRGVEMKITVGSVLGTKRGSKAKKSDRDPSHVHIISYSLGNDDT